MRQWHPVARYLIPNEVSKELLKAGAIYEALYSQINQRKNQ
jgi:hypothetical protein